MKKVTLLIACALLLAAGALAWEYSASTTWNGQRHVEGSTLFTPPGTTCHVSCCSPEWGGTPSCPSPGFDYVVKATLSDPLGSTQYVAQRDCGGNAYYNNASVTTDRQWKIVAALVQEAGEQQEEQGPVEAYAANPKHTCSGSEP